MNRIALWTLLLFFYAAKGSATEKIQTTYGLSPIPVSWKQALKNSLNFTYSPDNSPNAGFKKEDLWIKIDLHFVPDYHYLVIENAHLDRLILYQLKEDSLIEQTASGDLSDFSNRYFDVHFFNFKIHPQATRLLICTRSEGVLSVPVKIFTDKLLVREIDRFQLIHFTFFGLCILAIIIYLLFSIYLGERIYLYYVGYVFGSMAFMMIDFGYTFQFLWPHHPYLNHFNIIFYSVFVLIIFFSQKFLDITPAQKMHYLAYMTLYAIVLWLDVASLFSYAFAIKWMTIVVYLLPILILSSGWVTFVSRKDPSVLIFMLGWGVYMSMLFYYVLHISGFIPYSFFAANALQIGSFVEIAVLAIAVTYKINRLRQEHAISQKRLVDMYRQQEKMVREQNTLLEKMVAERTTELEMQGSLLQSSKQEIEEKNEELKSYNDNLEILIESRTSELKKTNEDLIDKNSRLEQFSYVTAHNLRGPVATLLGLANLLDLKNPGNPVNLMVVAKTGEVVVRLDNVIKSLTTILDLRKSTANIRENISFDAVLDDVKVLLSADIEESGAVIEARFELTDILGIHLYINNIFLNLISNAIKYRVPHTKPFIHIITRKEENGCVLVFKDNGRGFDLSLAAADLYKPFSRFHMDKDGKGIGLYMVKTQVELMKGNIHLVSEPMKGSEFTIRLPLLT